MNREETWKDFADRYERRIAAGEKCFAYIYRAGERTGYTIYAVPVKENGELGPHTTKINRMRRHIKSLRAKGADVSVFTNIDNFKEGQHVYI